MQDTPWHDDVSEQPGPVRCGRVLAEGVRPFNFLLAHPPVDKEIGHGEGDADTDATRALPAAPEVEVDAGPETLGPGPILQQRPAETIYKTDRGNESYISPIAAHHLEEQETEIQPHLLHGFAVVANHLPEGI